MTDYTTFAKHFDETRVAHWECVKKYLDSLPKYSLIADVGTGNGKYLSYRRDITVIGSDICMSLLEKAAIHGEALACSGLSLGFKDACFDGVMSIAVLHHILNIKDRKKFIKECLRVSRGSVLITVWAREQKLKKKWLPLENGDYMIPWLDKYSGKEYQRVYHLFTCLELVSLFESLNDDTLKYNIYFEKDNWVCVLIRIS